MPIYEYLCERCGAHLEVMQKIGDAPLKRCRNCKGKLEKIVSRTSFQLKGGGWYMTDYSRKSEKTSDDKPTGEKKTDAGTATSSASDAGGKCE